jgi:hypothetical protein
MFLFLWKTTGLFGKSEYQKKIQYNFCIAAKCRRFTVTEVYLKACEIEMNDRYRAEKSLHSLTLKG